MIIEIHPYRGGSQCFEAPGLEPYFTEANAKEFTIKFRPH